MSMSQELVFNMASLAKKASRRLTTLSSEEKNQALRAIADSIADNRSFIKAENLLDLKAATDAGQSKALVDRLSLNDQRIDDLIKSIKEVADLDDPVGKLITSKVLPNGMELKKVRVPIGVIGVIFEARPNVLSDVAALCLKSGNAAILRGGKECEHSNRAIMQAIDAALTKINFPPFSLQLVPIADRAVVTDLARCDLLDLIIPRGGESLIKAVADAATVPVIKHYKGVCHIFVDADADDSMALNICHNAKCQRPSVCNAVETILVHGQKAKTFLPKLYARLSEAGVELRGDKKSLSICPKMSVAEESDWTEEYLDLIVSVKVVDSLDEAIDHINTYGSHHSDAIITEDKQSKSRFTKEVDSAAVYVNASTRFTDGGVFGLGAEIGISTDKLHARGPMGLNELTTYKWVGIGEGQIR